VHNAIKNIDKVVSSSFCKIVPDYLTQDDDYCLICTDGAGTIVIVGIHVLERRNGRYFSVEGIAQDALIMNIDDLLCVVQPIIFYFHQQSVRKNLITAVCFQPLSMEPKN
jgi:phosphoribosylformylglycinamidine cyclo-ligase